EGHKTKAGTPTMGGILIFVAITVPFLILGDSDARSLAVWGTAMASAALGFADDFTKLSRKRSLGLKARHKLALQGVIAIALWYVATEHVGLSETLRFRVIDYNVDLGFLYPVLIFGVLAGATNGVNLTDGLDG